MKEMPIAANPSPNSRTRLLLVSARVAHRLVRACSAAPRAAPITSSASASPMTAATPPSAPPTMPTRRGSTIPVPTAATNTPVQAHCRSRQLAAPRDARRSTEQAYPPPSAQRRSGTISAATWPRPTRGAATAYPHPRRRHRIPAARPVPRRRAPGHPPGDRSGRRGLGPARPAGPIAEITEVITDSSADDDAVAAVRQAGVPVTAVGAADPRTDR
jgi:hypothetical protein